MFRTHSSLGDVPSAEFVAQFASSPQVEFSGSGWGYLGEEVGQTICSGWLKQSIREIYRG